MSAYVSKKLGLQNYAIIKHFIGQYLNMLYNARIIIYKIRIMLLVIYCNKNAIFFITTFFNILYHTHKYIYNVRYFQLEL